MDATQRSRTKSIEPAPSEPAPNPPAQLRLLSGPWRLNDSTREIGRRGVASAREALRSARRTSTHRSAAA